MDGLYMLFVIPVFFILMGIEYWYGKRKGKKFYRFNDTITNLNLGVGNQIVSLLTKGLLLGVFVWIYQHLAIFEIPNNWFTFIACLVFHDFLYYWAHRWGHTINFFWGAHVVHHQSEDFNLGVALRQSWFHTLIAAFIFFPLPILGFSLTQFVLAAGIATLYQFWIHTEAIPKLPKWFEFIFNTPSHHRVHHARDPKYIDKNYGAIFIIWDRIFGTFRVEEEKPTYGITKQIESWNPTWANFHYYLEMKESASKMKNWKDKIRLIFARPGWRPEELGGYDAPPPVENDFQKFNLDNPRLRVYVTLQFILIAFGLMAYMHHFTELSLFYKIALAGLVILSANIIGALLENKKWVFTAEYIRLTLALFCLNSLYYFQYIDWFLIMLVCSGIGFLSLVVWFTLALKSVKNLSPQLPGNKRP